MKTIAYNSGQPSMSYKPPEFIQVQACGAMMGTYGGLLNDDWCLIQRPFLCRAACGKGSLNYLPIIMPMKKEKKIR